MPEEKINEEVMIEDEIIEETSEETTEVVEENPEEKEQKSEDEKFDPTKVKFDDLDNLENIQGYNLSKFKDSLAFENPETASEIESYMTTFNGLGLSQEQVEGIINRLVEDGGNEKPEENKPLTMAEAQKILSQSLNREEKANYNATLNFVAEAWKGTPFESTMDALMVNPDVVKAMHYMYKKYSGKGNNPDPSKKYYETQKSKKALNVNEALGSYQKWVDSQETITPESRKNFINKLLEVPNKSELMPFFESLLED